MFSDVFACFRCKAFSSEANLCLFILASRIALIYVPTSYKRFVFHGFLPSYIWVLSKFYQWSIITCVFPQMGDALEIVDKKVRHVHRTKRWLPLAQGRFILFPQKVGTQLVQPLFISIDPLRDTPEQLKVCLFRLSPLTSNFHFVLFFFGRII
jgi:hypothetical protein